MRNIVIWQDGVRNEHSGTEAELIASDRLLNKVLLVVYDDKTVEYDIRKVDAVEVDGRVLYTADMGGALWY